MNSKNRRSPPGRNSGRIGHSEILLLKRWNTPSVYNGWEQITRSRIARDGFNLEETRDFMPQMGPMVGRALTVVIEPSNPDHPRKRPGNLSAYLEYVASGAPGPNIVVVQDLDKPKVIGSFWGECNSNLHRSFGCVGTITDGAVRDLDEMTNAGFKALARRLCVGHAHVFPVRWNCAVTVFGRTVHPGQLIHADKHGFLAIAEEDEAPLLEAARFMDQQECKTIIPAVRGASGHSTPQILAALNKARRDFRESTVQQFTRKGEW
jgi:regulator of RNase E activity RraA